MGAMHISSAAPRPRLKGVAWERAGAELRVVYDSRDQLLVDDPSGTIEARLCLLREGTRTEPELAAALSGATESDRHGRASAG